MKFNSENVDPEPTPIELAKLVRPEDYEPGEEIRVPGQGGSALIRLTGDLDEIREFIAETRVSVWVGIGQSQPPDVSSIDCPPADADSPPGVSLPALIIAVDTEPDGRQQDYFYPYQIEFGGVRG